MKKFLAILVTTASVVSANQSSPFHGLSLGGHLGFGTLGGNSTSIDTSTSKSVSGKISSNPGVFFGLNSLIGNVFQNGFYLGLGLDASIYSINGTTNNVSLGVGTNSNSFETKIKLKNSFSAAARFGFVCGNFLPFVELGLVTAGVKATSENVAGNNSGSLNKRLTGFSYGIGVAAALSDKLSAEVKVSQVAFKKKTFSLYDGSAEEAKTTIKPKFTALTVGLRYKVATF